MAILYHTGLGDEVTKKDKAKDLIRNRDILCLYIYGTILVGFGCIRSLKIIRGIKIIKIGSNVIGFPFSNYIITDVSVLDNKHNDR